MALTAIQVRKLGPGFHGDGDGLYLRVSDGGGRSWILRTVVQGRRRDIGLGSADLVTLAQARDEARHMRKTARAGGDPLADRAKPAVPTFEEAARKVYETHILPNSRNPRAMRQWLGRLERHAFPKIGRKRIDAIGQADMLAVLEPLWLKRQETARRVKQRAAVIFDWARTAGHITGPNPLDGIEAGLARQRQKVRHQPAVPWQELPAVYVRIARMPGMGALALRFAILTGARSGEVRGMIWSEVDTDAAVWTIPAKRMKMSRDHRVPLSPQALAVLDIVRGKHPTMVFPGAKKDRPLSDMTISAVLRRLEIDAVPHGMRSTFRDWSAECTHYARAVVETALSHDAAENRTEGAYLRTDFLERRKPLMAEWSNYVTGTVSVSV